MPGRRMLLAAVVALATPAAVDAKATSGGSKACPHTGFFGKRIVPLCEKHFPDEGSKNSWVIQFYHPHVQQVHDARELYEKMARDMVGGPKVGAVDCKENREFCQKHGIRGVPTTRIYHQDQKRDFEGDYSLDNLRKFVTDSVKQFQEAELAMECDKKGIFNDAKKDATIPLCKAGVPPNTEGHPWLVSFYEAGDKNKDKTMKSVMNKLAEKYGNLPPKKDTKRKKPLRVRVGAVDCFSQGGCEDLGITTFPAVRFYSAGTDQKLFLESFDKDELVKFVDARLKEMPKEAPPAEIKADMPEDAPETKKEEL